MARIGQGTFLYHSDNGTDWDKIAVLSEVGEFGVGEGDDIDVTNHDSQDGYREFIRGLVDAGEISFAGQWIGDASQELPIDGSNTGIQNGPTTTMDYFMISLPDLLGDWEGRGYWKSFMINPQLDDVIEFTGSIKVSGKPTMTIPGTTTPAPTTTTEGL